MDGRLTNRGLGIEVDWREIGLEFRRAGWGASRVARVLNLPRETIRWWFRTGAEPGYTDGLCLLRLHARVVCKQRVAPKITFATRITS